MRPRRLDVAWPPFAGNVLDVHPLRTLARAKQRCWHQDLSHRSDESLAFSAFVCPNVCRRTVTRDRGSRPDDDREDRAGEAAVPLAFLAVGRANRAIKDLNAVFARFGKVGEATQVDLPTIGRG